MPTAATNSCVKFISVCSDKDVLVEAIKRDTAFLGIRDIMQNSFSSFGHVKNCQRKNMVSWSQSLTYRGPWWVEDWPYFYVDNFSRDKIKNYALWPWFLASPAPYDGLQSSSRYMQVINQYYSWFYKPPPQNFEMLKYLKKDKINQSISLLVDSSITGCDHFKKSMFSGTLEKWLVQFTLVQ